MKSNFLHFESEEKARRFISRNQNLNKLKMLTKPLSIPTEHEEQKDLIYWCEVMSNQHPELKLIYAIPNGGDRNKTVAAKLIAEGVKSGVPDLCLPVPRHGYHGLYIEMKRQDGGGGTSDNQEWWINKLINQGYYVKVCNGFERAKGVILSYL